MYRLGLLVALCVSPLLACEAQNADTEEGVEEGVEQVVDEDGDGDGDGVSSTDDCNDSDATMPNDDGDCDGILTQPAKKGIEPIASEPTI